MVLLQEYFQINSSPKRRRNAWHKENVNAFLYKNWNHKKKYLINHDLKQKIINEHIDWIKKLKKEGINIKSGFLVDELKRPGAGGLLILEINNYENALKIIKNDPMIKNDLVEWKLNEWVDSNKWKLLSWILFHKFLNLFCMVTASC